MADKPSNNRKKVDYQPARNGQAARWRIEEREKPKERSTDEPVHKEESRKESSRKESSRKESSRKESSRKERSPQAASHSSSSRKESARRTPAHKESSRRETAAKLPSHEKTSTEKPSRTREPRTQRERAQARAAERQKAQAKRSLYEKTSSDNDQAKSRLDDRSARSERSGGSKRPERLIAENPQRARHSTSERTRSHVVEAMMPQTSRGGARATGFVLSRNIIIFAALVLIVVVFFLWHPWSSGTSVVINDGDALPPSDILEERFEALPAYGTVAPVDFNAIEEEGFTAGFVLVPGGVVTDYSIYETEPELSDESAETLNAALEPFTENDIITSFLIMDIQTGRGFARNIDKKLYGASSFKGPYCAFLLKQYVDNGEMNINDAFASGYMTENLGYARAGTDSLKNLIEETIVNSSNDAFASLRVNFSDATLASWLTSVDVEERVAYDTWFPFNTVRNMAKLWMEAYYYLQTDSEAANALREFMGSTTKSFMREALTGVRIIDENELIEQAGTTEAVDAGDDQTDDSSALIESTTLRATGSLGQNLSYAVDHSIDVITSSDITVLDKSGWNIDNDQNYDALVDCGIVSCNGRDYLLCVMCDAGYTDSNVAMFEKLISAVFEARRDLA